MEIIGDFNTTVQKALQEIEPEFLLLRGLVLVGTWPGEDDEQRVEEYKQKIKQAKEKDIPILGICFGFQVLGLEEGWRLEKLEKRNVGIKEVTGWWGTTHESFWHDYAVVDNKGNIINDLIKNKIIGTQFHPEYESSKDKPHPVLVKFLEICKK